MPHIGCMKVDLQYISKAQKILLHLMLKKPLKYIVGSLFLDGYLHYQLAQFYYVSPNVTYFLQNGVNIKY